MNKQYLVILSVKLLVVSALLLMVYIGVMALVRSSDFVIRKVEVEGDLQHVTRAQVERAVTAKLIGNFFTVNLHDLLQELKKLSWINRVEVRRVWPDRIIVRVSEHVVFARWNESYLLSAEGKVFDGKSEQPLPSLKGPDDSAQEVKERYLKFSSLLTSINLIPQQVILSQRRAWQLRLSNGLIVALGRDQANNTVESRLERFLEVYEALGGRLNQQPLSYVDLRYPNGFAVRLGSKQEAI